MAYGAEPAGAEALAHTIYIWPSRELVASSWHWPESWHTAFEQAASQIGRAVAVCVLGGLPVSEEMLRADIDAGAPTNADGTMNLVHYAAWLVREMSGRGD